MQRSFDKFNPSHVTVRRAARYLARISAASVLLCASALSSGICSVSQVGTGSASDLGSLSNIDAFVRHVMARWSVPGMALAVIADGKVVASRGYGVLEAGRAERVDADSVFQIGSMSKSFTATAAALLVDDGELDWDRPARDYLPALRYVDPWLTVHVTVRDLASNRVGVDDDLAWLLRDETSASLLHAIAFMQPDAAFRTYRYSNTGFATLGMITARASTVSWEELIRKRIFQPLGMTRSGTGADEFVQKKYLARCWTCSPPQNIVGREALILGKTNIAAPHGIKTGPATPPGYRNLAQVLNWRYISAIPAAGGITSTANDMVRFMLFHLNHGVLEGRRILSDRQWRNLHTPQVLIHDGDSASGSDDDASALGYALGWEKRTYHGYDVSMHSGGQVGFASTMWLVPTQHFAVVVMQNLDFQAAPAYSVVARQILDHYLGVAPVDQNARAERDWVTQPQPSVAATPSTMRPDPTIFAGHYMNAVVGDVDVRIVQGGKGGQNIPIMYLSENSRAWLRATDRGDYVATFEGTETNPIMLHVRFNVGSTGHIVGLALREEGNNMPTHTFFRVRRRSHEGETRSNLQPMSQDVGSPPC